MRATPTAPPFGWHRPHVGIVTREHARRSGRHAARRHRLSDDGPPAPGPVHQLHRGPGARTNLQATAARPLLSRSQVLPGRWFVREGPSASIRSARHGLGLSRVSHRPLNPVTTASPSRRREARRPTSGRRSTGLVRSRETTAREARSLAWRPRTPFGGGGTDIDATPGTAGAAIAGEGATSTGGVAAVARAPRWPRSTAVPPRHLTGRLIGGAHRR